MAWSVAELPRAVPQLWLERRPDVPCGSVELHRLRDDRRVWVYTPPGLRSGVQPEVLLVLLDGWVWALAQPVQFTLDNLVADGRVPRLVALLVDSVERDRELACHQPFLDWMIDELLPWAERRWGPRRDPRRTIVAGQSLGGMFAAFAALRAPHAFGNVISQSGSYWWKAGSAFDLEREWLVREYVISPRLPVRFYIEAGLMEVGGLGLLSCNRHLRDVLQAKGYEVTYREYCGGHDYACWRGSLADGLIALGGQMGRMAQ